MWDGQVSVVVSPEHVVPLHDAHSHDDVPLIDSHGTAKYYTVVLMIPEQGDRKVQSIVDQLLTVLQLHTTLDGWIGIITEGDTL